jgi:phosphonate transport system substrate-binding protein
MKRRYFIQYSLLFVGGCASATQTDLSRSAKPEKLRLAITDAHGMEELKRHYDPFRRALSEVLELPIEFYPVENFTAAGSALHLNLVDLVLAGPSEYVVVHARTNAVPVVELTRPGYRTQIVVRGDSGIKSLEQLNGKTIAMREVGSTSAHLGSTKLLMDAGLNPQVDYTPVMLGKEGFNALKNGKVDAWSASTFTYKRTLEQEELSEAEFPAIATGPLLPNDIFVANSQLDPTLIEYMRSQMLEHQDKLMPTLLVTPNLASRFQNSKIIPANDDHYNMIREAYKATGQGDFSQ